MYVQVIPRLQAQKYKENHLPLISAWMGRIQQKNS